MKIRLVLALVGSAISFAVPTFAQQANTPDPPTAPAGLSLALKSLAMYSTTAMPPPWTPFLIRKGGCGDGHRTDLWLRGRRGILVELFQKLHSSKHLITVDQNSRTL